MATALSASVATTAVILTKAEDRKKWLWQLHSNVSDDIWQHIDPDTAQDPEPLLAKPRRPVPSDVLANAESYAQLSAAHQKTFDNARRFYEVRPRCEGLYALSRPASSRTSLHHLDCVRH